MQKILYSIQFNTIYLSFTIYVIKKLMIFTSKPLLLSAICQHYSMTKYDINYMISCCVQLLSFLFILLTYVLKHSYCFVGENRGEPLSHRHLGLIDNFHEGSVKRNLKCGKRGFRVGLKNS